MKIEELIKLIVQLPNKDQQKLIKQMNELLSSEVEIDNVFQIIEVKKDIELENGINCPHCNSIKIIGYGKYRNRKRYLCKECGKIFNDLTGTPMSGTHYLEKWKDYLNCMIEGKSLRKIVEQLDIALQTAFDWRHKILAAFEQIGCAKLEGIAEADETFFLYSEKGNKHIKDRNPRKRGGKAKKRGISNEQVPVITSCDRKDNLIIGVAGFGRVSTTEVERVLGDFIDNNTTLCTDEHLSYRAFARMHNINYESINLSKGQRIKDKIYHIQNINSCHSRLKTWIRRFNGVATKYLSNYMNWFRMLEKTKNNFKRLQDLLNFSLIRKEIYIASKIHLGDQQYFRT